MSQTRRDRVALIELLQQTLPNRLPQKKKNKTRLSENRFVLVSRVNTVRGRRRCWGPVESPSEAVAGVRPREGEVSCSRGVAVALCPYVPVWVGPQDPGRPGGPGARGPSPLSLSRKGLWSDRAAEGAWAREEVTETPLREGPRSW